MRYVVSGSLNGRYTEAIALSTMVTTAFPATEHVHYGNTP